MLQWIIFWTTCSRFLPLTSWFPSKCPYFTQGYIAYNELRQLKCIAVKKRAFRESCKASSTSPVSQHFSTLCQKGFPHPTCLQKLGLTKVDTVYTSNGSWGNLNISSCDVDLPMHLSGMCSISSFLEADAEINICPLNKGEREVLNVVKF